MARGDKNYSKVAHDLSRGSGKSAKEKKKALHKMVEALIAEKTDEAQTHLHTYLKLKTREILVGEADDGEEEVKKGEKDAKDKADKTDDEADEEVEDSKEKNDDEEKEIEDDDKEKPVKEDFPFGHGEGSMSRKVQGKINFASKSKKNTLLKHKNSAPELSPDGVKDINFNGTGKKSGALMHGNNAPGLEPSVKGNFYTKKK